MSSQDKLEKVLRDIHVLISRSKVYDKDHIVVDKQEMFGLIDRLNASIYEIMEEYELTKQSRDKAEREHKKQGDKIIWNASRKAEDIYAASVMYTDEALNHLHAIMDESTEQIRAVLDAMLKDLEEKKQIVRTNQLELKSQLQDLVDTEKYLSLIEERNKEIEREKEKHDRRFEQAKEKSQFADVKTEIHVNKEYFRNAGIAIEEDEEDLQNPDGGADEPQNSAGEPTDAESRKPADEPAGDKDVPGLQDAAEEKEEQIDLSGAVWDVDGLDDPKEPEKPGGEQAGRHRRHKKWF